MDAVWFVLIGWLALSLLVAATWALVRRGASERSERLDDTGVARAEGRSHRSEDTPDNPPAGPGGDRRETDQSHRGKEQANS